MKKSILLLTAIVAVACMSCKKESKEEAVTKISFKESSVVMTVGDTVRFSVLWEPATVAAPTCTWTSSNEEVATVDANGNVAALSKGTANITAKTGELSAVCQVEVKSWMETIAFHDFSVWDVCKDETGNTIYTADSIYEVETNRGTISCKTALCYYFAWDENINWDSEGTSLEGAGYTVYAVAPNPVICEGQYKDYPIDFGALAFDDIKEGSAMFTAVNGKMLNAQNWYDYLLNEKSAVAEEDCINGAYVQYVDLDEELGYAPQGFAQNGYFVYTKEGLQIKFSIEWLTGSAGYGFNLDETGEKIVAPKSASDYVSEIVNYEEFYETAEEAKAVKHIAPKKTPIQDMLKGRKVVTALQHK